MGRFQAKKALRCGQRAFFCTRKSGVPIGRSNKLYPYPFLDYPRLGAKRFWLYVTAILAFFFALGCLFVWIAHLLT